MKGLVFVVAILIAVSVAQLPGACGNPRLPVGFLGYGVNPVLLDSAVAFTLPIVPITYTKADNKWYYPENSSTTCYPDQALPPMDLDNNVAEMDLSLITEYSYYSKNVSAGLHIAVNFNVPETNISVGGQFDYLHKKYSAFSNESVSFFSQSIRFVEYYMVGIDPSQLKSPELTMTLNALPVKDSPEACIDDVACVAKYCQVLNTYGTFYVSRVIMGGSINVTASFDKSIMSNYSASETSFQASLAIKYLGQQVGMVGGSYNTTWEKMDKSFREAMHNYTGVMGGSQADYANGGYKEWIKTLPKEPVMLIWKSVLTPIYNLIDLSVADNTKRYDTLRKASIEYFNSAGTKPCDF